MIPLSSQGWVKVEPPPRPRKPPVDPEVKKDTFFSGLRYFACQGVDQSRERLRMLGEKGFSPSQADLLRPHSRLERSSTLDEWRHDVQPSRSSSRQSGPIFGQEIPAGNMYEGGDSGRRRNSDDNMGNRHESDIRNDKNRGSSNTPRDRRRDRVASAPIIISASPSPSLRDEGSVSGDVVEVTEYPDHASVAGSETPSERNCRHNHRHQKARNVPKAIPEEDESSSVILSNPKAASVPAKSEHSHSWYGDLEADPPTSFSAPPPTRSNTVKSRMTTFSIADTPKTSTPAAETASHQPTAAIEPTLEPIPETAPVSIEPPTTVLDTATPARSIKSLRSERSHKSSRQRRSDDQSDTSSVSSRSARSESSYTSSASSYTEDDTASSYTTSSVRSASPIRAERTSTKHDRYRSSDKHKESHETDTSSNSRRSRDTRSYRSRRYDEDDDTSSYYPSPAASPPPPISRKARPNESLALPTTASRTPRDRTTTAPSWTSSHSSSTSSYTSSTRSRSTAPSMDGYQFQAAIFQPNHNAKENDWKAGYKGYRAPSLSKGNRWETATSALSFD